MNFRAPGYAQPRSSGAADAPLAIRYISDASGNIGFQQRLFYPTGSALSVGQTMKVAYTGAVTGCPNVITPVSGTVAVDQIVVAVNATVSGTWDWFWTYGFCNALVNGTTDVAINDYLLMKIGTSANGFTKDGSAITASTLAVAKAASTADSDNLTLIFLMGWRAILTQ